MSEAVTPEIAAPIEETAQKTRYTAEETIIAIRNSVVSDNEKENISTSKNLITRYMLQFPRATVLELINYDLKDHFGFKGLAIKILDTFHKERVEYMKESKEYEEAVYKKKEEAEEKEKESEDFDEAGFSEEEKARALREARRILKHEDPLMYILDEIKTRHVGDEWAQMGIAISISSQSCLNTKGINVQITGASGDGKSHTFKTHLMNVPAMFKREGSFSAKALYYADLKPGTIVFYDDVEPDEATMDTIKRSGTNYQEYTVHTTVKDQASISVKIPPRINWFLTSVNSTMGEEGLNRELPISAENSAQHKKDINKKQIEDAKSGRLGEVDVTFKTLVCRRIYSDIKLQTFRVIVPFADRIELIDYSNPRIFSQFLDMIKGFTIFYHEQRKKDEDGNLIASEDDFILAKALFDSQQENAISKLNKNENDILRYIYNHNGCTLQQIVNGIDGKQEQIRRVIHGRPERNVFGLLDKVNGLTYDDMRKEEDRNPSLNDRDRTTKIGRNVKAYYLKNFNATDYFAKEFITLREN